MTNRLLQDLPPEWLEMLQKLQPPELPHRDTLIRRLALPRTFTRALYDIAVSDLASPPPFDASPEAPPDATFTGLPDIEPVSGFPGRYSLKDNKRSEMLTKLVTHEDRRFAALFLTAMSDADAMEQLDRLELLFWTDQTAARAALQAQFEAADRRNDISRCTSLVQLVASVIGLLGDTESRELLGELTARAGSRNVFFSEFFQTETYFPRTGFEGKLNQFLNARNQSEWIFHTFATGGMGKTTTLRRLLSHEWIVGAQRIPCAWLDFDYLDVDSVLQAPTLLALPMAAQWNEQLATPLFGSFLEPSLQPFTSVLLRARSDGAATGLGNPVTEQLSRDQYRARRANPMHCGMLQNAVAPPTLEARNEQLSSARSLRFMWDDKLPGCIAAMPAERPVLIVLDTLEEASLYRGRELLAILELIGALRDKVRSMSAVDLRIILSGRKQLGLADHVPEFQSRFKDQFLVEEMRGFGDKEAADFLALRLAADRRSLIPAMVKKSLGIPFNLSLFAEWAAADPDLDEQTIRTSEEISTVMLLERIIKRIPYQPLRWIIRYGVVPRSLNLAFLRDVMRQPLEDALSGKAQAEGRDRPNQDQWSAMEGFEFDADQLWRDYVLVYAAQKGWMIPSEGSGDMVGFRADIRNPMRRMLRLQGIFGHLHRRAQDWFGKRAHEASRPDAWAEAQLECLYHCLQVQSYEAEFRQDSPAPAPGMLHELRAVLDHPWSRADARLRRSIAAGLLTEDFADLTDAEKGYVEYRLAEATAATDNYAYTVKTTVAHLARAFELLGNESGALLPPFAHEWRKIISGATLSAFLSALSKLPPDDVVQLAMLVAESGGKRSPIAADVLKSAIAVWPKVTNPTVPLGAVQEKLGRYYADTEVDRDRDQAIPLLTAAAEDYQRRGDMDRYRSMLRRAASVHLKLGRILRAEQVLKPVQTDDARTFALDLQLARIALAKGNSGEALEYLGAGRGRTPTGAEAVEAHLLRAEALSQRALWLDAGEALQEAVRSAQTVANTSAVVRAALTRLRLDYWWMRRVDPSSADLAGQIRGSASPAQIDELDVWQLFLRPDQAQAQRRAVSNLGGNSAHGRVRLILMLSHVLPEMTAQLWHALVEQAAKIPASARVVALMEPVLLGKPPKVAESNRRAIAESLRGAPEGPVETAWHAVRYGELLAWLGLPDEALELLRSAIPRPSFIGAVLPWQRVTYRERRRVEQRMRDWGVRVPPEPDPPDFWTRVWVHTPFRSAAVTIENARRAADEGDWRAVDQALLLSAKNLEEAPFRTAFHEIADRLRNPQTRAAWAKTIAVDSTKPAAPKITRSAEVDQLEPRPGEVEYSVIAMRPQAGRLAVRVSGGPDEDNLLSSDGEGVEILLRSRGIPRRLTGMNLVGLMWDLQSVFEQSRADVSKGRTLCLRTPLGSLSAAPWELGMPEDGALLWRSPSGWLQDAGRGLRESLLAAHLATRGQGRSTRQSPVTMIAPMSPQDRESSESSLYSSLARSSGVEVVGEIDPKGRPVSVLYIASCFAEPSTLVEPVVAGTEITASQLAERLQLVGSKPTVILDVPAVRTENNLVHQLLLRNYFAQVLLDSGAVNCVIATGLFTGPAMHRIHELLLNATGRFADWTQAQVAREIRSLAGSSQQPATTALFTALPDLPWLPPVEPVP